MARPALAVTLVSALLLARPVAAQDMVLPADVRAAADAITATTLARDLAYLASDDLRGRDTGSPGFDAAARYIEQRLRASGLTPAGDDGTYRQHYALRELRVNTSRATLTIGAQRFAFGDDFILRSFAGPIDGEVPVVYVGHGWHAPQRGIDPWRGVDVRGALVLAHGPRAMPKDITLPQVGRVPVGASSVFAEAKARGAVGVLFLTSSNPKDDWLTMQASNLIRRELDPSVSSAYAAPPVTSLLLAASTRDALLQGERYDGPSLLQRGEAGAYPRAFRLRKRVGIRVPLLAVSSQERATPPTLTTSP